VVNVDGTSENKMPNDIFRLIQECKNSTEERKNILDKVKNIFS
jgi:hypothetical protein